MPSFIRDYKDMNPYPAPSSVPVVTLTRTITQTMSVMLESFRATYGQVDVVLAILILGVLVALSIFAVRRKNG